MPKGTSYFYFYNRESIRGLFGAVRILPLGFAFTNLQKFAKSHVLLHSLTRVVVGRGGPGDGPGDGGVRVDLLGGGGAKAGHEKHQKLHVAAVAFVGRWVGQRGSTREGEGGAPSALPSLKLYTRPSPLKLRPLRGELPAKDAGAGALPRQIGRARATDGSGLLPVRRQRALSPQRARPASVRLSVCRRPQQSFLPDPSYTWSPPAPPPLIRPTHGETVFYSPCAPRRPRASPSAGFFECFVNVPFCHSRLST